jgi:hypothetical protein
MVRRSVKAITGVTLAVVMAHLRHFRALDASLPQKMAEPASLSGLNAASIKSSPLDDA